MKRIAISGRIFCRFLILSLFMVLSGCGGGGGDGGSSSMVYSGVETQAVVTTSNAEDIVNGAYFGVGFGSGYFAVEKRVGRLRYLQIIKVLEKSTEDMGLDSIEEEAVSGAVQKTASGTIYGSCGGSATTTITYDDVTGEFSGSMNFNHYCSETLTMSGGANLSGQIDLDTKAFIMAAYALNDVSVTYDGGSLTMRGTIVFHCQPSPDVEMTLLLRDNSDNKVYRMTDYIIHMSAESDYIEIGVTGKFYHPDYGFVDVSTTSPFRIYSGDGYDPSEGVLVLEGSTGLAGGSTLARLTALSASTYEIAADTDGDGSYDWSSVKSW